MSQPYIAEMRIFSFGFAPKGWALCNGQILSINQNQALFSILGTTFGGNGVTTFALPNLQGNVPVYVGQGIVLGQAAGSTNVTVTLPQLPQHMHMMAASSAAAGSATPDMNVFATVPAAVGNVYSQNPVNYDAPLNPLAIGLAGNSQPHNNMQPYLVLNICIALVGIFPSRN